VVYVFTTNAGGRRLERAFADRRARRATPAFPACATSATTFFRWLPMTLFLFVAAHFQRTRANSAVGHLLVIARWRRRK
jgi:hypothetical protein